VQVETHSVKFEVLSRLNQSAGLRLSEALLVDLKSDADNPRGRSFKRDVIVEDLADISFVERVKYVDIVGRAKVGIYVFGAARNFFLRARCHKGA
jgi:hypothetical protein